MLDSYVPVSYTLELKVRAQVTASYTQVTLDVDRFWMITPVICKC